MLDNFCQYYVGFDKTLTPSKIHGDNQKIIFYKESNNNPTNT